MMHRYAFSVNLATDTELIKWLESMPGRERSTAIRNVLLRNLRKERDVASRLDMMMDELRELRASGIVMREPTTVIHDQTMSLTPTIISSEVTSKVAKLLD